MCSAIQENITGVRVVKAFGAQSFEIENFEEKSRDLRDKIIAVTKMSSSFWSNSDLLCMLQFGVVLLAGVYFTTTGGLHRTMVAFLSLGQC